jgi:G:T-mismatch repair DNA endonuclease (very short patch repair protein)
VAGCATWTRCWWHQHDSSSRSIVSEDVASLVSCIAKNVKADDN